MITSMANLAPKQSNGIDYGAKMRHYMQLLVHDVLEEVSQSGLPGEHHFFITFDMTHHGVVVSDWLRATYPEEMTIVIQHHYEALHIADQTLVIDLNFDERNETVCIPIEAFKTFVDPTVEFGLRFENKDGDPEKEAT